ncbi:MAG: pantoate--beta-alanine ligase [Candidatus Omnitrophica bacterium]|nr:pantoate--beta-alanine ligase [Candidatus Omnitrophota bacterium]MDD5027070.1 pantoate--beta-alanine ligase [Candidatus Omnitrophota bacterium]MDD5662091.1 pantoate--beta-alanine ligase [Candidatus Omnitrophota bacterium]
MKIIKLPAVLYKSLKKSRSAGKTIGFVPTMGALHAGHLSLIRQARKENSIVVVSIFVNPAQFGPKEDLKKYPRPLNKDLALCRKERVDFVFSPRPEEMYGEGFSTYVNVERLSETLCGKSRPGHFRGVATIVAKLLNIGQPDIIYLGQKDAQQAIIVKRMARDLNIPVKVKIMPTVRQRDGLALSSRNAYLDKKEKKDALVLSAALNLAKLFIKSGARDASRIINRMKRVVNKKKSSRIDYIAIVDTASLKPVRKISGECLIALAVRIGRTRLIDNIIVRA